MKPFCVWLTGIPASGKTTLAHALRDHLAARYGMSAAIIDGDDLRASCFGPLGFDRESRRTQCLRAATIAKAVVDGGGIAIVALISPYYEDREIAYHTIGMDRTLPVWAYCDRIIAHERDPKGLYAKAEAGEIAGLTGWDDPYESPTARTLRVDTARLTVRASAETILDVLGCSGAIPAQGGWALFVGRWSPLHKGHCHIFDEAVNDGHLLAIGVRCSDDAYTVAQRIEMIRTAYPTAWVFPVPDIASVNIGRKVGYDVVRYDVPAEVAAISATAIREKRDGWESMVPEPIRGMIQ